MNTIASNIKQNRVCTACGIGSCDRISQGTNAAVRCVGHEDEIAIQVIERRAERWRQQSLSVKGRDIPRCKITRATCKGHKLDAVFTTRHIRTGDNIQGAIQTGVPENFDPVECYAWSSRISHLDVGYRTRIEDEACDSQFARTRTRCQDATGCHGHSPC